MIARGDMPWLSVLMPIFNGAATLEGTLASLEDQAAGIEVIFVDQGSSDGSVAIAKRFREHIDIRIVERPENKNWVQNTNEALNLARAPRATMLHQDDLWKPGRSARLKQMFERDPEAALWVHGADYVDDTGRRVGTLSPPFGARPRRIEPDEALPLLIVQNTIALPSAAFSVAEAWNIGGLDETLWYTADWNFWLGLAERSGVAWHPQRAVAFRLHSGSLTLSGSRDLDDLADQLATPVERHAQALSGAEAAQAIRFAKLSNLLNVWLASAFHGSHRPVRPVVAGYLALGPKGWGAFLWRTRIVARFMPRLRLLVGRRLKRHG